MPARWSLGHLVAAGGLLLLTACGDGSGGGVVAPSVDPGTAVMVMQPQLDLVHPGDVVEITVLILDAMDVVSTPFKLRYDALSLEFQEGIQGPFLAQTGAPVAFLAGQDSLDPGVLTVGLTILGAKEGAHGDGELCRLRFRVLGGAGEGKDYLSLVPFSSRVFASGLKEMPSDFRPLRLRFRKRGDR